MVDLVSFGTAHLPPQDRFGHWCSLTADTLIPNVIRSDHAHDFRGAIDLLDLGAVRISRVRYPSLTTHRTARLVRRSDPEEYQLMLSLKGRQILTQARRETTCDAGGLMLYDTSQPWDGRADGGAGDVEGILVQFPRTALPLPDQRIRPLIVGAFPGGGGTAGLLAGHLLSTMSGGGTFTAADGPRLADLTTDLLGAVCARHLGAERELPPEVHRRVLLLRVRAFIRSHLADPDLGPATVAAACGLSKRHLHRLFREEELTAARWIRGRRLECCRADLEDPALSSRPVHAIGARWGLTDPAHFNRAFRAAYGVTPGEYRATRWVDPARTRGTDRPLSSPGTVRTDGGASKRRRTKGRGE